MKLFGRLFLTVALFWAFSACSGAAPFESPDENAGIGINQDSVLAYPFSMTVNGILEGETRIVISVDAKGELTDVLVVGYTNVVFANAAVAAFKRWTYEPARAHGKARASRVEVLVIFKNGMGVMVQSLPTSVENSLIRSLQERYSYRVCQLRDLDRIPTPLQVVPPTPPKGGLEPGAKRTVTVEFYIDENGRVRMPAIDREEPDDSYAAAAVSAVERWRFEPPVRKGRPVLVLARQDFNFVPKP